MRTIVTAKDFSLFFVFCLARKNLEKEKQGKAFLVLYVKLLLIKLINQISEGGERWLLG